MRKGRSEPANTSPNASTTRRSVSAAAWKLPEKADLVIESEVQHAVGRLRAGTEAVEVVEGSPMHFGTSFGQRRRGRIRTGEPDDLMTIGHEFRDDGRADPTGCTGDEDTHGTTSNEMSALTGRCQ